MEEQVEGIEELQNPGGFKTFKTDVYEYSEIDSLIKQVKEQMEPLKERLKELTNTKKILEKDICHYMGENDIVNCNLPEDAGTLRYQVRKSPAPVTQQHVKDEILAFFIEGKGSDKGFNTLTPTEKAEHLIEYVYKTKRKQTQKPSLRKVKPRAKKATTKDTTN